MHLRSAACSVARFGFCGCGVDDGLHFGDGVGWESALGRVFANELFVGGDVDAVDFVAGDVAMDPLNFGPSLRRLRRTSGRLLAVDRETLPAPGTSRSMTYLGMEPPERLRSGQCIWLGGGMESVVKMKSEEAKV